MEITYITDLPEEYSKAIDASYSYIDLLKSINDFSKFCSDALENAPKNDDEFKDFMNGLRKERRGIFAGEEYSKRYGPVLMPELLFRVSIVAEHYKVPWGLAFIRLREQGMIVKDGNKYVIKG